MSALICGSFAYDTIMVYQGHFKDAILPDKVHMLNVSFLVPDMRREFGGCAGNIIYNLQLLGGKGIPMGTVGRDFAPYAEWMAKHGINGGRVRVISDAFTAQAYITTDLSDNQISAFHPGAMNLSHTQPVDAQGITLGVISPDGRDGMLQHAQQFAEADIPFIFDPGQGLPMFDGEELRTFIDMASVVTVNDYEGELLRQRTGLSVTEIADRVDALIITGGSTGSVIYHRGRRLDIPPAKPVTVADPTGCGDAYRAGIIYGMMHDRDWETTGRIASLMGAIKIEKHGTQNHGFTMAEFWQRYQDTFGTRLDS